VDELVDLWMDGRQPPPGLLEDVTLHQRVCHLVADGAQKEESQQRPPGLHIFELNQSAAARPGPVS
jgi:hypothetical protein